MKEGIAIFTSGGDSAGMSPAIKYATQYARQMGYRPWLVYDGLRGLIDDKFVEPDLSLMSGILHRGGTFLRSARSRRFRDIEFRKQAYENLQKRGISKLIVIGGDGSFRALHQFHNEFGVHFAGIPATIDNDIPGTDYCLGVDTALNVIRHSVDSIRDTAHSFSRAFVIEVMGRNCGYLAMVSALTSGAEVCLVPEIPYDLESISRRLQDEIKRGRNYILGIVAEGTQMGEPLTNWINEKLNMEARLTILGHVQRGGSPTVRDRLMAHKFAVGAVDALQRGEKNSIVVYREGSYTVEPVQEISDKTYKLDATVLKLCRPLSQ